MEYRIAVLPGDGIGPEIIDQAIKVLKIAGKKFNHNFEFTEALVGATAIDKAGDPFPEETFQLCMDSDAVLFGAIGDPKYDNDPKAKVRPEQGLLAMRKPKLVPATALSALELIEASGVRWIKFHGMRHTSATLALKAGVPVKLVAQRLGHAKTDITNDIYAHALPSMQKDAAAKLSSLLR